MTLKQQNYTCLSDDTYAKGWNRTPDLVLPDDRKRISVHETWYSFRIEKPFSDDSNQEIQTIENPIPRVSSIQHNAWQQKGQRSQRHGRPAECSSSGRRRTCPSTGAGKFPAMRAACCSPVCVLSHAAHVSDLQ